MAVPSAKRPQCTRFYASYYVETAYGNAFNDSAINKWFAPNEPVLFDIPQTREDDAAIIKGHEFPLDPTADVIIAQDVSAPLTFRGYLNILGWMFSLISGADSVVDSAPNYKHTFKIQDACINDQPPSTNVIATFSGDTASYYKFKGVCLNELKVAVDKPGVITVSGNLQGDGSVTVDNTFSAPTAITNADVLAGVDVGGTYGYFKTCDYGGSLTDVRDLFMGGEFTVNQNLDIADGRLNFAANAKYLGSLRFGNRVVTLTVKLQGHQGDIYWQNFLAKTVKAIEWSIGTSATKKLVISIPKCTIASIKGSFNGIRDMNEITYKAYYETSGSLNSPWQVEVWNTDAAYLKAITPGM
jgi:hypothetical protein